MNGTIRGKAVWLRDTLQVMLRIRESEIGDAAESSGTAFRRVGWLNVKGRVRNARDADEPHVNIEFLKPLTGGVECARDYGILGHDWRRRKSPAEVKNWGGRRQAYPSVASTSLTQPDLSTVPCAIEAESTKLCAAAVSTPAVRADRRGICAGELT
jgi:hypothetical protein